MTMEIKYTEAYKSSEEIEHLNWKMYTKNTNRNLILYFIIGLACFVYGILTFEKTSHNESYYSESKVQILSINNYSTWHFSFSFGLLIILVSAFAFKGHMNTKKKYFKSVQKKNAILYGNSNEFSVKIDSESLKYYSFGLNMDIKWIMFSDFIKKENYIFLNIEKGFRIPIDQRLVSSENLSWLLTEIEKHNIKEIK